MPFDKQKLIECPEQYFSATVGPVCNRISNGRFEHNGKQYQMKQNQSGACLHSNGLLSSNIWQLESKNETNIVLSFTLPKSEWNFNCKIFASFKLENNQIIINYISDIQEPTPLALTSHPFFNLDGSKNCEDIILEIPASKFVELNHNCCSGAIRDVNKTFDFRKPRRIGEFINNTEDEQIKQGIGYDHCYILDDQTEIKRAGIAYSKLNGLKLTTFTNQPSIHFYAGNWLNGLIGKNNIPIEKRHSFCIEAEQIPDSLNRPDLEKFGKIWYDKGEKYNNIIIYQID